MQDDKQNDSSDDRFDKLKFLEERVKKRRGRASPAMLIFYIITLILAIVLMLWLRSGGKFFR